MRKECVILNGRVINIGPWDYQYQMVQVGEDEEGNPIYEERAMNPMPEGAVIEEREIEIGPDGGLYVVGEPRPESPEQKIARLESELAATREENLTAYEAIAELYEMFLANQTPPEGSGTT